MSIKVILGTEEKEFEKPLTLMEILGDDRNIVCATVNNRVRELTYTIDKDCKIAPLTVKDRDAKAIYEASLRYLVAMAMHNLYPEIDIRFSYNVSRSVFMQILTPHTTSNGQMVHELEKEMKRLVDLDLPFVRQIVSKEEAAKIFANEGFPDKVEILGYRPEKTCHIYHCGDYKNYMYNRMVPSTGYIQKWKVKFYHPGIIIQYPRFDVNGEIPPFEDAQHDERHAAEHPQKAAEPVRAVPVLLGIERPRELDAHGVALLRLWQIVADDDEHHTHECGDDLRDVYIVAECIAERHCRAEHADHRHDPPADVEQHRTHVRVLRVGLERQRQNEVERRHQPRQAEHGERLTRPAVRLIVKAPVRRHLLRQLIIKDHAHDHGNEADQCSENEGLLFKFHRAPLLSAFRSRE